MSGYRYESQQIQLARGTRIVLYTDGVTEAENSSLELFGSDRLIGWASSSALVCSAEGLAGSLLDAVKEYTGDIEQNDDITVMTVIYK